MSTLPTLTEQLRSFWLQNASNLEPTPKNIEKVMEYFAVFGGMGWDVDLNKPLELLIQEKVLANYRYIHGDITKITHSNKLYHSLLSALATGDAREYGAFKKARIGRSEGEEAIDFLVDNALLERESSQAKPLDETQEVSDKLHFTLPFMRFWFALISPYYKGIKEGDFSEFEKAYAHAKSEFSHPLYAKLVMQMLKERFNKEDRISKIGAYWDATHQLDLLAKTAAKKVLAGSMKFSKAKMKKSEIGKVESVCEAIRLPADMLILFSKSGFSSELKNMKSPTLRLFTLKHLAVLLENLSEDDRIEHHNKRY